MNGINDDENEQKRPSSRWEDSKYGRKEMINKDWKSGIRNSYFFFFSVIMKFSFKFTELDQYTFLSYALLFCAFLQKEICSIWNVFAVFSLMFL